MTRRGADRKSGQPPRPTPSPGKAPDEQSRDLRTLDFLLPGGQIDGDAMRAAIESGPAEDDAPNRVVFHLQRDLQKRLDKYLTDRIPFMSRTQLQRLIDEGGVTVNGRSPKASTVLRNDDVIEVFVPPPPSSEIQPEDIPLDVLHEDESLIVLNKSADFIVHPARSHLRGTMVNALAHHFRSSGGSLSSVGREFARPGVVHRLDRNTTGAIVFAKNDEVHWRLGKQFEQRTVDKRYIAIVHGVPEPAVDVIDLPLGPHPSKEKGYREKYVVRHDDLGRPSVTIYRVLERYGDFSMVELELKTGRTHQIRVHLSHLGWPIVGDDMYGGRHVLVTADSVVAKDTATSGEPFRRQALHAATLAFNHPATGQRMSFTAPLPSDMQAIIRALRKSRPQSVILKPPVHQPPGAAPPSPPGATVSVDALMSEKDEHHELPH